MDGALRAWAINRRGQNSVRNSQYGPRPRLIRDICLSFQAKVKYTAYPPWAYVIYMVFVLVPSICIIYPPLNDCFTRRRAVPETRKNFSDSGSSGISSCELGCIVGRSKSYNITPISSPYVNGHVNRTVDEEDWNYEDNTKIHRICPNLSELARQDTTGLSSKVWFKGFILLLASLENI